MDKRPVIIVSFLLQTIAMSIFYKNKYYKNVHFFGCRFYGCQDVRLSPTDHVILAAAFSITFKLIIIHTERNIIPSPVPKKIET